MSAFNNNDIVKIAVDSYKGKIENYSTEKTQEALRNMLVQVNNGSTKVDYRAIRDGKCNGLFSLLEEILGATVHDYLSDDVFYNTLVDVRNVEEGDSLTFVAQDSTLFYVADVANGTQGIKRQRLAGATEVTIPTTMKMVRIYEELNRVLSGRIDFNEMIDRVALSFNNKLVEDIYSLWVDATSDDLGGSIYFPVAGSYDEDTLLDLIAHVEAAAGGQTATIIGTKKALRNLESSILADSAKEDLYNNGYYGKFYGSPVIAIPQRYKTNTTDFILDDNVLTIIAGDDKPVKLVYEGDPLVITRDASLNADLTQEYVYGEKYGLGLVLAGGNAGIGKYVIE